MAKATQGPDQRRARNSNQKGKGVVQQHFSPGHHNRQNIFIARLGFNHGRPRSG